MHHLCYIVASSPSQSSDNMATELQKKREEATNLRIKTEEQIEKICSSVSLHSIDEKLECNHESLSSVSTVIFRKTCQLESLGRLVVAAEERLAQDKELVKKLKEDAQSADNPETKQGIDDWLNITNDHISELLSEIKRRQETAAQVSEEVTRHSDAKSMIQQQIKSNPSLHRDIAGNTNIGSLVEKLQDQIASEESIKKALDEAS